MVRITVLKFYVYGDGTLDRVTCMVVQDRNGSLVQPRLLRIIFFRCSRMLMRKETTWLRAGVACVASILFFAIVPGWTKPTSVSCQTNAWCQVNDFDVEITKLLVGSHSRVAGYVSHIFTFVLSPVLAMYSALLPMCAKPHPRHVLIRAHAGQDFLILLSSILLSLALCEIVKNTFLRQRPCFYYHDQAQTEVGTGHLNEEYKSFFSGDATAAFVSFTSGLTLAKLRGRAYAKTSQTFCKGCVSPMAAAGGVIASLGALLRVVGYMHWTTDAVTGSLFGSFCGISLPLLLFRKNGGGSPENKYAPVKLQDVEDEQYISM